MQKAAIFLRGTHQTIETIAGLVGYQEPAFFSKTFKAVMGLPPGAYRKQIDVLV